MESFLESIDMDNLKSMIANDSDYDDEVVDMGAAFNERMSQTSEIGSKSAKSNIKSPKNKYKRPTFHI